MLFIISDTVTSFLSIHFISEGQITFLSIHFRRTDYCVQSGNINYELGRNFQIMHTFAAFILVLVNTQVGTYFFHFCEKHRIRLLKHSPNVDLKKSPKKRRLRIDSVPSRNLPKSCVEVHKSESYTEQQKARSERYENRIKCKKLVTQLSFFSEL